MSAAIVFALVTLKKVLVDMEFSAIVPANRLGVAMTVKTKIATKNINNLNFANVLSRLMSFSFPFEGESR